jgi:hypothetical protein
LSASALTRAASDSARFSSSPSTAIIASIAAKQLVMNGGKQSLRRIALLQQKQWLQMQLVEIAAIPSKTLYFYYSAIKL